MLYNDNLYMRWTMIMCVWCNVDDGHEACVAYLG